MGVRSFARSLNRTRNPGRVAARERIAAERTSRLAGAAQQFRSPQLSSGQGGFLGGLGATAGLQGLFGGAVSGAIDRSRTQFLAGNRLGGLQGLLDDFFNFAPQGVAPVTNLPVGQREVGGTLAQITGLNNQFLLGGQAGREGVLNLDPGAVGGFLGRRQRSTLALPRRGLLGQRAAELSTPGSATNDLARRFAESQGVVDTGGFIGQNPQLQRVVNRAGVQGLDATQANIAQDFFGAHPIVADSLTGPEGAGTPADFQSAIFSQIAQQINTPRFGIRDQAAGAGLAGLSASGILPFFARRGNGQAFQDLFSPALFGSGR